MSRRSDQRHGLEPGISGTRDVAIARRRSANTATTPRPLTCAGFEATDGSLPHDGVQSRPLTFDARFVAEHFDFVWRSLVRLGVTRIENIDDAAHDVFLIATSAIRRLRRAGQRRGLALRHLATSRDGTIIGHMPGSSAPFPSRRRNPSTTRYRGRERLP
ncbi:MAG: hypothetical protein QM784_38660, partial [Polyangiaceae bacterium]